MDRIWRVTKTGVLLAALFGALFASALAGYHVHGGASLYDDGGFFENVGDVFADGATGVFLLAVCAALAGFLRRSGAAARCPALPDVTFDDRNLVLRL